MARRRLVTIAVAGACASLVFGSVLARTSDSITSQGNSAQSGTFETPHDIQANVGTSLVDCATVTYSNGPITVVRASTINLETGGTNDPAFKLFCIKNTGLAAGAVYAQLVNTTDTEVGTCSASESSATEGNDQTCASGAAGELSGVLNLTIQGCNTMGPVRSMSAWSTTPAAVVSSMAPGATCEVSLVEGVASGITTAQRTAAQTDRLQYDLVLTLRDS